jgi:trimethylamine--corrinoid protein Co-methyltransferase
LKFNLQFATNQDVEYIHELSLLLLKEVGTVFHSEKALKVFKKHGAKVDGNVVYLGKNIVEKAIETAPATFSIYGREGDEVNIGGQELIGAQTYGPIHVYCEGRFENSSHEHYVNFHKLAETSDIVKISNPMSIDVSFVEKTKRNMYRLGTTLKYCKKPLYGIVDGGMDAMEKSIDIMQEFYGINNKIISIGLVNTMGPMQVSPDMCDALMVYSRRKQALIVTSGGVVGANVPQSMASSFIMGNAAILAAITLTQLINPGTPVVYCGKFASSDIRHMAPAYGGVESMLGCATSQRMAEYYRLPLRSSSSNTESKVLDYQAGAETFMNILSAYFCKVDLMQHACGLLDSMNAIGYEKFILDEEMHLSIRRLIRGYNINEDTACLDLIREKGPSGRYFGKTTELCRTDFFLPKYSIRENYNNWMAAGCPTGETLATKVWKKRLEEYELPELTKEQKKIIDNLIPKQYQRSY